MAPVLAAVLSILNSLDAIFTVLWGWTRPELELNPIGRALLERDPTSLADLKVALSLLMIVAAMVVRDKPVRRHVLLMLGATVGVYALALVLHLATLGIV